MKLSTSELNEIKSSTLEEDWEEPAKPTSTKQVLAGGFWQAGRKWMQQPIESQLIVWKSMNEDRTEWFFYDAQLLVRVGQFAIGSRFYCVSIDTTESTMTFYHTVKNFKDKAGTRHSLIMTVGEKL